MKSRNIIIMTCCLLCITALSMEARVKKSRKGRKNDKTEQVDTVRKEKPDKYLEAIKDAETYPGLFKLYMTPDEELLFEFTPENFKHLYLLTNRMSETSNDAAFGAGQLIGEPVMIRMEADSTHLHFYLPDVTSKVRPGDPIEEAYYRNNREPIVKSFKVKAFKKDSLYLVDMTDFFSSNEEMVTPQQYSSNIMGRPSGSFDADGSRILEVKSFPENVEITSQLNYHSIPRPYLVKVRRSILQLPDEPMKVRYQDNRVGYFSSMYEYFSTDADRIETRQIIHRWRLEPKEEDRKRYFQGDTVEPREPIIFYVDSAFPDKWRDAVKAGVEDWQKAFEAAGFKNAIIARDYPDPETGFDPDDIRYNCIRYIVNDVSNASGPSYVDPRTGEILVADVNWFHNVVSLVNNWKFCQTAAADPRVRQAKMPDEVMEESLRYVASHEVGHTLGLMHNMGASSAFPVDSLRSPSFTQKYGTTPSIMDYARNNFIAQPGDFEKGVRMVPPLVGVYDIHAIRWGYRLFPGDPAPEEEKPLLNAMIDEKAGDPMYEFGAQQVFNILSPTDQTEDLGDDHMKAGDYAVSNLKYIVRNMEDWLEEDGTDYMEFKIKFFNVANQYRRHLFHVYPYLGGVKFHDLVQGQKNQVISREYVSKATQKRAMEWIVDQVLTFRSWMLPKRILDITGYGSGDLDEYQRSAAARLFSGTVLTFIAEGERSGQEGLYTLDGYMKDAVNTVTAHTRSRKELTVEDMNLQNAMVAALAELAGLVKKEPAKSMSLTAPERSFVEDLEAMETALASMEASAAGDSFCSYGAADGGATSYYRQNNDLPTLSGAHVRPIALRELKRVVALYKSARTVAGSPTRTFYDYQVDRVERLMKK